MKYDPALYHPDIQIITDFRTCLTSYGFELYIADFFEQGDYNFHTTVDTDSIDRSQDVHGIRREDDGTKTHLVVRCRKWYDHPVSLADVASFHSEIISPLEQDNLFLVYATTAIGGVEAQVFCAEHDILLLDSMHLADLDASMGLYDWLEIQSDADDYAEIATEWFRNRQQAQWDIEYATRREITMLRNELTKGIGGMFRRLAYGMGRVI